MPYPAALKTHPALQIAFTLLLAWLAAHLCLALKTPLPWMIGPLLATAIASVASAPVNSWKPFRNTGQWVIGAALGLYFTPEVVRLLGGIWWAITLGIIWALALGIIFSKLLLRQHPEINGATAYFAGAVGGASEMTILSEKYGARTELVAAAHSVRILTVVMVIPFIMQWSGLQGLDNTPIAARVFDLKGFAWLALATGGSIVLMLKLKRANPFFLGALVASMILTANDLVFTAIPPQVSNAAQLVIGISLGIRFTPDFIHTAPRWLLSACVGTLVMLMLCALFSWGLSKLTGIHVATLVLSTSPGGIAEMAITAKVLQLGVPIVTAFQACRLVAVLLLVEPAYARWFAKLK